MVQPGKGILAADESSGTIKKRFDAIGVESTPDNRRDYRELLFRATDAMKNYISGTILYDETILVQLPATGRRWSSSSSRRVPSPASRWIWGPSPCHSASVRRSRKASTVCVSA